MRLWITFRMGFHPVKKWRFIDGKYSKDLSYYWLEMRIMSLFIAFNIYFKKK